MAYRDFNNFPEKTAADKVLRDKSFKFVKKTKPDENKTSTWTWFFGL